MFKGKKILAITLARGGSKGIPNKNIADINGKPLLRYTTDQVQLSELIDNYIVSTDSPEIKAIAESGGVSCPFLRPAEYSSDGSTSADALIHAVEFLETAGQEYDYIVEVMVTNPLKIADDIDQCLKMAIEESASSCVAVNRLYDQHPARIKFIENGVLKSFYPEVPESRRQDLSPPAYIRSGSIYVVATEYLKTNKSRYSANETLAYVLPDERVINIDEPNDLELARIKLS